MTKSFIREKKIQCGDDYREVDIFPATDRAADSCRGKRQKISRPAQRNLNDRNSRRYFVQLAEANFADGDWSVELTYFDQPETLEAAKRQLRRFLARLKYACDRQGAELRWLAVTSDIDGESGETVRVHHHLFLSGGLSFEQISACWRERGGRRIGRINIDRLQADRDFNISGKAYYFGRQGRGQKRWSGSRNLVKPVRLPDNDHRWSRRRLKQLCEAAPDKVWGKDIRTMLTGSIWAAAYPGWRIVSYEPIYNDDTGWSVYLKLRREVGG